MLITEGGPVFFGGLYQSMAGLLPVLDQLTEAYRTGGGVPANAYGPDWFVGLERFTAAWFNNLLVPQWLPAMPAVARKLHAGADVADIGCGRGQALIKLATDMLIGSRQDVLAIADGTIAALEALDSGGGPNFWSVAPTVVAVAALVAGTYFTAGAGATAAAKISWALVRGGFTIAAAGASVAGSGNLPANGGGDNVVDILESMVAALDVVRETMTETEDNLTQALEADIAHLEAPGNLADIVLPRPIVLDADTFDDFRPPR